MRVPQKGPATICASSRTRMPVKGKGRLVMASGGILADKSISSSPVEEPKARAPGVDQDLDHDRDGVPIHRRHQLSRFSTHADRRTPICVIEFPVHGRSADLPLEKSAISAGFD